MAHRPRVSKTIAKPATEPKRPPGTPVAAHFSSSLDVLPLDELYKYVKARELREHELAMAAARAARRKIAAALLSGMPEAAALAPRHTPGCPGTDKRPDIYARHGEHCIRCLLWAGNATLLADYDFELKATPVEEDDVCNHSNESPHSRPSRPRNTR